MTNNNENPIAFGIALQRLRTARGITQEEIAFECELSRYFIGLIEKGKKNPSLNTVVALAGALSLTTAELITEFEKELATQRQKSS